MAGSHLENICEDIKKYMPYLSVAKDSVEAIHCKKHGEKYDLFCRQCTQLVCKKCSVNNHKGHSKLTLEETVETHRENVKQKYKQSLCKLKEVHGDYKMLNDAKEKCLSEVALTKAVVQKHGEAIKRKVTAGVVNIHSEIDSQAKQVIEKFKEMEMDKIDHVSTLVGDLNRMDSMLKNGDSASIIDTSINTIPRQNQLMNNMEQSGCVAYPEIEIQLHITDIACMTQETLVGKVKCSINLQRMVTLKTAAKVPFHSIALKNKIYSFMIPLQFRDRKNILMYK